MAGWDKFTERHYIISPKTKSTTYKLIYYVTGFAITTLRLISPILLIIILNRESKQNFVY